MIHSVTRYRRYILVHSPLIEGRPQSARQRDSCDRRTAHELRPPLSHIEGFVTSSRRTDVHWDDDTRSEFIAQIDLEANRFAELVESLCTPVERSGTWAGPAERGLAPWSAAERGFTARTPEMVLTQPASVVQRALHRVRGLLEDSPRRLNVGDESDYMWTFVQRIRRKIEPDRAHPR